MADQESIFDRIHTALANLAALEIVTAVGPVSGRIKENDTIRPDPGSLSNCKMMYTKIDLLQGDITTCIPEEFITGDYQELREFHQAREQQGHEIIKGNIAALRELIALARQVETQREGP